MPLPQGVLRVSKQSHLPGDGNGQSILANDGIYLGQLFQEGGNPAPPLPAPYCPANSQPAGWTLQNQSHSHLSICVLMSMPIVQATAPLFPWGFSKGDPGHRLHILLACDVPSVLQQQLTPLHTNVAWTVCSDRA